VRYEQASLGLGFGRPVIHVDALAVIGYIREFFCFHGHKYTPAPRQGGEKRIRRDARELGSSIEPALPINKVE